VLATDVLDAKDELGKKTVFVLVTKDFTTGKLQNADLGLGSWLPSLYSTLLLLTGYRAQTYFKDRESQLRPHNLDLNRTDSNWQLNPRAEVKDRALGIGID
jgi:hypothetical protein